MASSPTYRQKEPWSTRLTKYRVPPTLQGNRTTSFDAMQQEVIDEVPCIGCNNMGKNISAKMKNLLNRGKAEHSDSGITVGLQWELRWCQCILRAGNQLVIEAMLCVFCLFRRNETYLSDRGCSKYDEQYQVH